MRGYLKQERESLEMQNRCAEIKIRAQRRGGELLAGMERAQPGNNQWSSHDATTLSDLNLTKSQSSRWQQIAAIPEDKFEAFVAATLKKRHRSDEFGSK